MAIVNFYEKPGCRTNARQKRMLEAAGHTVHARSLLAERWTAARLRDFFGSMPVAAWFNPAAPRVKTGEIIPSTIDGDAALALMLKEPILIRRPLIETDGQRCAGFDREPVTSLLGPNAERNGLDGCSRGATAPPCPDPQRPESTLRR